MIKRASEMKDNIKVNMRGGDGQVSIREILLKGEYKGNARLVGTITLEPGCSIGAHVHENEEEIFYIIKGTATYDDNGTEVILNEGDSCLCLGGEKHSVANRMSEGTVQLFAVILTY
ncbi:MAG: cupin domain-containing protein [Ruminococcaceae bacterium]|nr:cupin domain-containing protein [Oscillospiraceae bacterium]